MIWVLNVCVVVEVVVVVEGLVGRSSRRLGSWDIMGATVDGTTAPDAMSTMPQMSSVP